MFQRYGIKIHFAHRTFKWSNEASGKAAVHCVIIGFANFDVTKKVLFEYADIAGEPLEISVKNINPYLIDAKMVFLEKRMQPICISPEITKGSEATDFGHLILSTEEMQDFLVKEPASKKWLRKFIGGEELINNVERWCLWLVNITPQELKSMPNVMLRVERVKQARLESGKARTKEWAAYPTLFSENRQPTTEYLAIPKVSSERRKFIPIGYISKDSIANGSVQVLAHANLFHFGILSSTMHMAWMRAVCGRMKSDYQYSNSIVYNNYPWPQEASDKQQHAVSNAAQAVLDARAAFPESSLADLYDPLSMPPILVKAHQTLDKAVDACYGKQAFNSDAQRVAYLFELYQQITSLLPTSTSKAKRSKSIAPTIEIV
jgi:hypothetical protein